MDMVFKNVKLIVRDAKDGTARGEHLLSRGDLVKLNQIAEEAVEEFAAGLYAELGEPEGKMEDLALSVDVEWMVEYVHA